MINATGLWVHKTKDGKSYMSGNLGGLRVMIFKNEHKTNPKHPDYRLVVAENKPKDANQTKAKQIEDQDDDMPF